MSRKIKLKAWDKIKNEICEVMGIDFIQNMVLCFPITKRTARAGKWRSLDEFELLEFTGLHEKTGREIYEGDYVKKDDGIMLVKYDSQYATFCFCDYYLKHPIFKIKDFDEFEVVGNIYEGELTPK